MAKPSGPGGNGNSRPENRAENDHRDDELERRRQQLEATLATRRQTAREGEKSTRSNGVTGYGQALKLSSEFIAGIAVGVGLGWIIDRMAGTSPWGLIVFLLLGFGAGVLNVLRSAGMVTEAGIRSPDKTSDEPEKK
ncbi:AtpZ/AtpI family protein [Aminobacter sp. MDW-2]|jgi:ATP synthase protein I|uniref:AtpZ/AtpI family protein n=1 Tax=Aminobacter sp. MDW-2 TaxID=2666139 RepID=UPI0012B0459F|nr:AtpZ/AtpI family protein [Aminobacter sp. MDW-2]MRX36317.1 ATP F0F1 synthase subunit I [Aminobacter sp. MDW-2]QNH33778.1 AtpZ/AtpI family protein [Aminobacter sp. MDW-2]